jgi:hypothetical protein
VFAKKQKLPVYRGVFAVPARNQCIVRSLFEFGIEGNHPAGFAGTPPKEGNHPGGFAATPF